MADLQYQIEKLEEKAVVLKQAVSTTPFKFWNEGPLWCWLSMEWWRNDWFVCRKNTWRHLRSTMKSFFSRKTLMEIKLKL